MVARPRLIDRLDEGLHRKLTLVCAPAGFGKTTLLGGWLTALPRPTAWVSLDEGDNDPSRFLSYLVAALRIDCSEHRRGRIGCAPIPTAAASESILTALLNEINTIPDDFVLVLDDYHVIDARAVDDALAFPDRAPAPADAPDHRHPGRSATTPGPPARQGPIGRVARPRLAIHFLRSRRIPQRGDGP